MPWNRTCVACSICTSFDRTVKFMEWPMTWSCPLSRYSLLVSGWYTSVTLSLILVESRIEMILGSAMSSEKPCSASLGTKTSKLRIYVHADAILKPDLWGSGPEICGRWWTRYRMKSKDRIFELTRSCLVIRWIASRNSENKLSVGLKALVSYATDMYRWVASSPLIAYVVQSRGPFEDLLHEMNDSQQC